MTIDVKYWVWLSSLVKITPRKRFELVEYFSDPAMLWHVSEEELHKINFLDTSMVLQIINKQQRIDCEKHMEKLAAADLNIITIRDSCYPYFLKNIYDPPVVLYCKGKIESQESTVAVVGSRRASQYGLEMAENISRSLSINGLTVSSGMARGIDTKAHVGALKAGGRTIAVLGCGADKAYPYENKELMKQITSNGAVITEFLPGTPPLKINFPARNRIISGISMGTVIVEASEKSGSLITANCALEQGREVFAVPGNISSENSKGTNRLIRDGAKIVLDIADILDELKISKKEDSNFFKENHNINTKGLENDEITIVRKLKHSSMHIDKIATECKLPVASVGSLLIMLEMKGIVEQLPGKIYRVTV